MRSLAQRQTVQTVQYTDCLQFSCAETDGAHGGWGWVERDVADDVFTKQTNNFRFTFTGLWRVDFAFFSLKMNK